MQLYQPWTVLQLRARAVTNIKETCNPFSLLRPALPQPPCNGLVTIHGSLLLPHLFRILPDIFEHTGSGRCRLPQLPSSCRRCGRPFSRWIQFNNTSNRVDQAAASHGAR